MTNLRDMIEGLTRDQQVRQALEAMLTSFSIKDLLTEDEAAYSDVLSLSPNTCAVTHHDRDRDSNDIGDTLLRWKADTARFDRVASTADVFISIVTKELENGASELAALAELQEELQNLAAHEVFAMQYFKTQVARDLKWSNESRRDAYMHIVTGETALHAQKNKLDSVYDCLIEADLQRRYHLGPLAEFSMLSDLLLKVRQKSIRLELDLHYLQAASACSSGTTNERLELRGMEDWHKITAILMSELPVVLHLHNIRDYNRPYRAAWTHQALKILDSARSLRCVLRDIVLRQQAGELVTEELRVSQRITEDVQVLLVRDLLNYASSQSEVRSTKGSSVLFVRGNRSILSSADTGARKYLDVNLMEDFICNENGIGAEVSGALHSTIMAVNEPCSRNGARVFKLTTNRGLFVICDMLEQICHHPLGTILVSQVKLDYRKKYKFRPNNQRT